MYSRRDTTPRAKEEREAHIDDRTGIRRPDWLSHESISQCRGNANLLGSRSVDGSQDKRVGMRMQIARRSSMRRTGRLLFAEPNRLRQSHIWSEISERIGRGFESGRGESSSTVLTLSARVQRPLGYEPMAAWCVVSEEKTRLPEVCDGKSYYAE